MNQVLQPPHDHHYLEESFDELNAAIKK